MKQLYCPHRVTVSGILQYCSNGKSPMDCEYCNCPDKKELDVTVTTSSSEILSNKMKREEEMIKASYRYAKHQQKPFIDGAKWADKSMIEKACEWLAENCAFYFDHKSCESELTFIEDFKKAMEE